MKPVFLLLGPEEGEKDRFIQDYVAQIHKETGEDPELHRYYPFESELADVFALLKTGSLFSQHRIAILYNIDELRRKDQIDFITNYVSAPASEATLFLVSTEIGAVDKRIQKGIPKECRKIFWELFDNRKADWIRTYFHRTQITIDPDAIDHLLEVVENNTKDLKRECGLLAQFLGTGSHINTETVEKYCYHNKEENVFTLFEHMARRELTTTHAVLNTILLSKESEPTALLSGLLWQVRRLLKLKMLIADNFPIEEAFGKIRLNYKKGQRIYLEAHKNYTLNEVERLIPLIAEFDIRLRSFAGSLSSLLLELFIYYAVVRGGKVPRNIR